MKMTSSNYPSALPTRVAHQSHRNMPLQPLSQNNKANCRHPFFDICKENSHSKKQQAPLGHHIQNDYYRPNTNWQPHPPHYRTKEGEWQNQNDYSCCWGQGYWQPRERPSSRTFGKEEREQLPSPPPSAFDVPYYPSENAFEIRPHHPSENAFKNQPRYASENAFENRPRYASENAFENRSYHYSSENTFASRPHYPSENAFENRPHYSSENAFEHEPHYSSENLFDNRPINKELGVSSLSAKKHSTGDSMDLPPKGPRTEDFPPKGPCTEKHQPGELRSLDIVCGRGAPTNFHYGNQAFKELVEDYQTSYLCAKRSDKPQIAMKLMDIVKSRGARFVRRQKTSGHFAWIPIEDKGAYEKICQALRDGAPDLRRQMLSSAKKKETKA